MSKKQGKAVLVTTAHRGVFFGYLVGTPSKAKVKLTSARNCVYWSADVKGVFGLAVTGPSATCKVGPAVPELELLDVTSVSTVAPEAQQKWESSPWAR